MMGRKKPKDPDVAKPLPFDRQGLESGTVVSLRPAIQTRFSNPERGCDRPSPSKWKMAIVTSAVIYPFLLINPILLSPIVGDAPKWVASLFNVLFTIPLMTWLVMPAVTKLLRGWLYK